MRDDDDGRACAACAEGEGFRQPFTMAFQPILDIRARRVFAHEALVRTPEGGGAGLVLSQVTAENRYAFDQAARSRAISLAARGGLTGAEGPSVSINFMPNAVYEPDRCLRTTLAAARTHRFPVSRIVFEFTEDEEVIDVAHLAHIVARYRAQGFRTALDDFGAGFAGLGLLADIQPDIVKLDMRLVRGLDADPVRREIAGAVAGLCGRLGIALIAEGVETGGELRALRALGIHLIQGYLIARPALGAPMAEGAAVAALAEAEADAAWAGGEPARAEGRARRA